MKEIILATNNLGKVNEFNHFFAGMPVTFVPQSVFSLESVEETGQTFIENAIIKARHATEHTGKPAIGDDSGLVIDALNGAPGIKTARYAGEDAPFSESIEKVLFGLEGVPFEQRTARVYCVLAYLLSPTDPAPVICQGVWECLINLEPKGEQGFGFDPVIYVPSHHCTAAEMEPAVKNKISHRAIAVRQLLNTFHIQ